MDLALRHGVLERAHDVLLADDVGERARAVAAIKRRASRHGTSSLVVGAAPPRRAEQGLADPEHLSFGISQSSAQPAAFAAAVSDSLPGDITSQVTGPSEAGERGTRSDPIIAGANRRKLRRSALREPVS